ncbi:MAG: hypothetical protein V8T46_11495 [Sutterella seckii]
MLDAVFIEGHTDNLRSRGDTSNWRNRMLSASRANWVFEVMVLGNSELADMTNSATMPVLSIRVRRGSAAVASHVEPNEDDQANRGGRFRFIFEEPKARWRSQDDCRARPCAERFQTNLHLPTSTR